MDKPTDPISISLAEECRVFCRYLIHREPNDYVLSIYKKGHSSPGFAAAPPPSLMDKMLIRIARRHPMLTRVADAYSRVFFKRSLLRRKLVLLLAILESCAPGHYYLDSTDGVSRTVFFLKLVQHSTLYALSLVFGVLLFLPLHIFTRMVSLSPSEKQETSSMPELTNPLNVNTEKHG